MTLSLDVCGGNTPGVWSVLLCRKAAPRQKLNALAHTPARIDPGNERTCPNNLGLPAQAGVGYDYGHVRHFSSRSPAMQP